MVIRIDGNWNCVHCGAPIDLPTHKAPRIGLAAASGKPTMRTLTVDGFEVHRCELNPRDVTCRRES